ncbi:MAG TPA: hypothetical protein VMP41_05910 [Acidimicrobiales bacterium]|nr:hypothetical protein [Acidimicrobiales bacterium]
MSASVRQRAERQVRWYPKEWRARYGEEFTELLVAELEERPRSLRRDVDLARSGLTARVAAAGLGGQPLEAEGSGRRSLATLAAALSVFSVVAVALWAQLTIGWQWAPPATRATSLAMVVMSVGILAVGTLCLLAIAPVAWVALRSIATRWRHLLGPVGLVVGALVVLAVGTHHFANGWPGTRGHPWTEQGIVPGGVAAYAWASTLFVTSYWLHPAALAHFPGGEVAWMLVSPVAVAALIVGATRIVRRVDLSSRVIRYERRLGLLAAMTTALYLTGAALWIVDGGAGPRNLFHIGSIDNVELAALALLVFVAGRAAGRVTTGNAPMART